ILPPVHVDAKVYTRPEMTRKLWSQLFKVGIISARATPTAGKTTMGDLITSFVERNIPSMKVIHFSWPGKDENGKFPQPPYTCYQQLFRKFAGIDDLDALLERQKIFVVVDEAQNSYPYDSFWTGFIKNIAEGQCSPYVLLLSLYGSSGLVVTDLEALRHSTSH